LGLIPSRDNIHNKVVNWRVLSIFHLNFEDPQVVCFNPGSRRLLAINKPFSNSGSQNHRHECLHFDPHWFHILLQITQVTIKLHYPASPPPPTIFQPKTPELQKSINLNKKKTSNKYRKYVNNFTWTATTSKSSSTNTFSYKTCQTSHRTLYFMLQFLKDSLSFCQIQILLPCLPKNH